MCYCFIICRKCFPILFNYFEIYQFFTVIILSMKFTERSTSGMYILWFILPYWKQASKYVLPVHLSFGKLNNRNSEIEIKTGIVYKGTESVVNHKSCCCECRYFPYFCVFISHSDVTFKSRYSFPRRKRYLQLLQYISWSPNSLW
jgi:hypothetical protein